MDTMEKEMQDTIQEPVVVSLEKEVQEPEAVSLEKEVQEPVAVSLEKEVQEPEAVGQENIQYDSMQNNMQYNMQNGMQQGNMQYGMQNGMQGNMQYGMQNNMQGNMQYGMQNNMQGNMPYGMPNNMQYNNMQNQQTQARANYQAQNAKSVEFAREYFKLLHSARDLTKKDIRFYFDYFESERDNKWNILKMLAKDFKMVGLGSVSGYASADKEVDTEALKKVEASPVVMNIFQEATILKIRRSVKCFEYLATSDEVRELLPMVDAGYAEFLGVDHIHTVAEFSGHMKALAAEANHMKSRGMAYAALTDFFKIMLSMLDYQDVVDNFTEFKLLLRYEKLTPYMYGLDIVKNATLKKLAAIAVRDYGFRDEVDFIINYFVPMQDHFDLCCKGTFFTILSAKSKAKKDQSYVRATDACEKEKVMPLPVGILVLHWLSYWPVAVVYFVFETMKAIFCDLQKLSIGCFLLIFVMNIIQLPSKYKVWSFWSIFKIFNKRQWYALVSEITHGRIHNGFESVVLSLVVILILFAIYVLPALWATALFQKFASLFDSFFDWKGTERTFGNLFKACRTRTEIIYTRQKEQYVMKQLPFMIVNVVFALLLFVIFIAIIVAAILL